MIWNDQSWDIIDAHVHTFPDAVAEKAVGKLARLSQITPYTNGTLKDTREKLEACGIGRAVLLNIATSPRQQNSINHSAAEINQSSPQRWTALGSVHFQAEDALAQLEQIHAAHIPGIKLHPDEAVGKSRALADWAECLAGYGPLRQLCGSERDQPPDPAASR